jgi:hypothetical protein
MYTIGKWPFKNILVFYFLTLNIYTFNCIILKMIIIIVECNYVMCFTMDNISMF